MADELIHGDRRLHRRYYVELPLRFSYPGERGRACRGYAVAVELSRGGVRFRTDDPPPVGKVIRAEIAWPFLLQGVCPLELAISGRVVRVDEDGVAMQLRSYEFRTCGDRSFVENQEQSRRLLTA